jgi:hypothetical protein
MQMLFDLYAICINLLETGQVLQSRVECKKSEGAPFMTPAIMPSMQAFLTTAVRDRTLVAPNPNQHVRLAIRKGSDLLTATPYYAN